MSSLIVPVAVVEDVQPHPNADRLEITRVLGWQVVAPKGLRAVGEKVVYFPPDTVLPPEVSDRFGNTKYLKNGRVRHTRLRGEPSFGFIVQLDDESWAVGTNVAEHYQATKYEPPVRLGIGDAARDHPLFFTYTDVENLRNFPDAFLPGEPVVATEKIHGTNCRLGLVEGEWMVGSRKLRRCLDPPNLYSAMLTEEARRLLQAVADQHGAASVVLYGEVFGPGVQSMAYGQSDKAFRAFDLAINGMFVDYPEFVALADGHGIARVPEVFRGPYALETVRAVSEGPTVVGKGAHYREGVVVRPLQERNMTKQRRLILKYVSDTYLFGEQSDSTDV